MVSFQPSFDETRSILDDVQIVPDPKLANSRHYPAMSRILSKESRETQINQLFEKSCKISST